jgi:ABC-2 type transport system permease protein
LILGALKNPILVKEIRTRMRGHRAFLLVTTHLLLLSLLVGMIYLIFRTSISSIPTYEDQYLFSKLVFGVLVIFELVMITFIVPALSAGSFSLEKERHTYDLLRVTMLSEKALVFGKFASTLSFIFLLLLTSIPMLSPAFLIGGVLGIEILISVAVLSVCTLAFSAVGLFFSSVINRTLLANVLTYACAVFMTFGIPLLLVAAAVILQSGNLPRIDQPSPTAVSIWLIIGWCAISLSPLASMVATEYFLLEQNNIWWVDIVLNENTTIHMISPWISHVLFYSFLVFGLIWITIQRVKYDED